ncbi:unnamed protein product [Triticum turgidum subsp. durum]|uniref:Uncharacterized protein n=1 Tax=Triticum turgidum subsp. durum TaxID=4567 RepID=A0A9R0ZQZ6_TRITD|nr:unnamed protein product [Triticum turgidum subsp. durum]
MGSGDWFKTIISKKKSKRGKSKHAKKVAAQRNGANLPQQKPSNAPSSSSDPEDNAALEDWAATRLLQAELRNRRAFMVTEGRNRKKKQENQVKLDAKLQNLQVAWNGGSNTMDEIVARIHLREEAAVKRERAMAYAFNHQWRAKSATSQGNFNYGVGNGGWGWSWMDRWIAARPWEPRSMVTPENTKKGQSKKDNTSTNQSALKLQGAISLSNNTSDRKVPKNKSSPSPDKKKPVARTEQKPVAKTEQKPKAAGPPKAKPKDMKRNQEKQQQPAVSAITA